ncbi:MAG TPA: EipA family protein [Candidatus Acidoferrales bacterium]|nr:EipA family protein [Candidatus Acidoferrales bacterium]
MNRREFMSSSERVPGRGRRQFEIADIRTQPYPHPRADRDHDDVEGGGAVVAGLRYGEGILYTKNAGDLRVFWQGPSLGYDFGVDGARTMSLKSRDRCS